MNLLDSKSGASISNQLSKNLWGRAWSIWRLRRPHVSVIAGHVLLAYLSVSACSGLGKHPGQPIAPGMVKESTKYYIDVMTSSHDGIFQLRQSSFYPTSRFRLIKIHDDVWEFKRRGEAVYFTHCEFESTDSQDTLDIDFWLVPFGDTMRVIDIKIHKINGETRFAYEGYDLRPLE